ncbi:hypothetical protein COLO4_08099 [Corchorus olitorius]|uniref:Uncharacterized protein n=1 Tax=Corchorus olitorius TaxID=93759 RepID=A0A1R3KHD5_9ROSI|nr:hypothetical protein COLO4_08099 [Corchorus olitorius]
MWKQGDKEAVEGMIDGSKCKVAENGVLEYSLLCL